MLGVVQQLARDNISFIFVVSLSSGSSPANHWDSEPCGSRRPKSASTTRVLDQGGQTDSNTVEESSILSGPAAANDLIGITAIQARDLRSIRSIGSFYADVEQW
jgi:hypothetical protein